MRRKARILAFGSATAGPILLWSMLGSPMGMLRSETLKPPTIIGCAGTEVDTSTDGTEKRVTRMQCADIPRGSVSKEASSYMFLRIGPPGGKDVWVRFEDLVVQQCQKGKPAGAGRCFPFGFTGRGASECRATC